MKNNGHKPHPVLDAVRQVIAMEAQTLRQVGGAVDGSYLKAIRLIARCKGKIIVTGIGKSGIIAQKIAATLASTGTPALYMHPSEGMHGDLGLIEKRDLVLAVGKSGESHELNTILPSLRRIGVKLITITATPDSTLGRQAEVVLATPVKREACPLNLAPTCSTTAALAVGDALAVALMQMRNFKKEHFALNHPGGQLGKRLTLRVADIMRAGAHNPVVRATVKVSKLLDEITRKHAGAASVVDKRGRLVGFVTDYDVRQALVREGRELFSLPTTLIMNRKPLFVRSDRLAAEAVDMMTDRRKPFNVMPVVDRKGRAVGLLHIQDVRAAGL